MVVIWMKEMFDSVNKAQQEYRANMTAFDQHIAKCGKYWKEYGIYMVSKTKKKNWFKKQKKNQKQKKTYYH